MTNEDHIVALDLGTSSVRALLFDSNLVQCGDVGSQKKYQFTKIADGGVEVDPDRLVSLTCDCLDELHAQMASKGRKAVGVGMCTFWHCFVGIDADGSPTTPIVHLLDTRSIEEARGLTKTFEASWIHAITGCMPHTSYWPAKLLWFRNKRPEAFAKTVRWLSVGEYLLLKLTGQARESISMISASGMWDQRRDDYCEELLEATGVERRQLSPVEMLDEPVRGLLPAFAERWPLFHGIPWYPAYGDGACNSMGSGCTTPKRFALMVGTTGAMRVVVNHRHVTLPAGIWGYRVSRGRSILGGAISNGGEVYRWATQTFLLPEKPEELMAGREPGAHGLTVLPYLAGERSPYWRPELRATISGMSLSTTTTDILQACLESVSLRFRQIYTLLTRPFAPPDEIVGSGGGLLQSKVWQGMMADALGHPLRTCLEPEASSRGVAMLVAEQMGLVTDLEKTPPRFGVTLEPDTQRTAAYQRMLEKDNRLFDELYGPTLQAWARD
jgi:gluconokinase